MYAAVMSVSLCFCYVFVKQIQFCVVGLGTKIYGNKFSAFGSLSRVVLYFLVM
jgi:hypothetical protein